MKQILTERKLTTSDCNSFLTSVAVIGHPMYAVLLCLMCILLLNYRLISTEWDRFHQELAENCERYNKNRAIFQ